MRAHMSASSSRRPGTSIWRACSNAWPLGLRTLPTCSPSVMHWCSPLTEHWPEWSPRPTSRVRASSACCGAMSRSPELGQAAAGAGRLDVPLWIWAVTIAVLIVVIGIELVLAIRHRSRDVRVHEAGIWVVAVIMLAVAFGLALRWLGQPAASGQYFAGWMTEWSLSLDNLFLFVLLIERSAVPRNLQNQVLLLGIAITLLLRGIMIVLGSSALNTFSWIQYVFGAVVIVTAARLAFSHGNAMSGREGPILRAVK